MKTLFPILCLTLGFSAAAAAAPLQRDLGRGLIYHRASSVPTDLPVINPAEKRARVLDLRYARGDAADAAALFSWLKFNASPRTPVFLLANTHTAAALLAPFTGREPVEGVLIIGAGARDFRPDIAVKVSSEVERQAYDALEAGSEINSLLQENPHKRRNDEAQLTKNWLPNPNAADSPLLDDAGTPEEKTPPPKTPPPLVDPVLQRAWHLHRGLLALKRI